MKEILDNKVTLNPVELCSELATKRLIQYYEQFYPNTPSDQIEDIIYVEDEEGNFILTDHAQALFNDLYDEYWTLLEKLAI